MPPSSFPFKVVSPEDMVPGNLYYLMSTKDSTRKAKEGKVRKMSGIFKELVTHRAVGEREKIYAVFEKVNVEGRPTTLHYNSGRILNPLFEPNNIMKAIRNTNTRRVRNVKRPGHQNLNLKSFGDKEWLFNISNWKFGTGIRNAVGQYSAIQAFGNRGVNMETQLKPFFPRGNLNANFNYVNEGE
jgi:hypothetical protein